MVVGAHLPQSVSELRVERWVDLRGAAEVEDAVAKLLAVGEADCVAAAGQRHQFPNREALGREHVNHWVHGGVGPREIYLHMGSH